MTRPHRYRLDGHTPVPVDDLLDWARYTEASYGTATWCVAADGLPDRTDVSTVFLGLDHAWEGPPKIFETRVFGGEHDGYQERCATWDEAEAGHARALALAKTGGGT